MNFSRFRNLGIHNGRQYYGIGPGRGPWIKTHNIQGPAELPYEMTMEQYKALPQFDMKHAILNIKGVLHAVKPNEHYKTPIAICSFDTTRDSDIASITYPVKIVEE